jgi:hypothetical protein
MKKALSVTIGGILLLPFLVNLAGWDLYGYVYFWKKDLVVACAQGVSHNALTEHLPPLEKGSFGYDLIAERRVTSLRLGPFELFVEKRIDPMQSLRFHIVNHGEDHEYNGLEFPWLLIPLIGFSVTECLRRKKQSKHRTLPPCRQKSPAYPAPGAQAEDASSTRDAS